jgi:hypothetical protein
LTVPEKYVGVDVFAVVVEGSPFVDKSLLMEYREESGSVGNDATLGSETNFVL